MGHAWARIARRWLVYEGDAGQTAYECCPPGGLENRRGASHRGFKSHTHRKVTPPDQEFWSGGVSRESRR
ncbi:hypothetical protein GCM10010363_38740 [Streptomyces omiyaensis]|nr:hypothetical protein GCM10010363_38740 [Streptomyces omiyaensis]